MNEDSKSGDPVSLLPPAAPAPAPAVPGEGAERPGSAGNGPLLAGALVQKIFAGPSALVLKVRRPGKTLYVLGRATSESNRTPVFSLSEHNPKDALVASGLLAEGMRPSPLSLKTRRELEGGKITGLREDAVFASKAGAGWTLRVASGELRLERSPAPPQSDLAAASDEASWLERGRLVVEGASARGEEQRATALKQAIRKACQRLERRLTAIQGDLAKAKAASAIAENAPWFIAAAARAPRGARSLEGIDWSSGEPRPIALALDPARPAKEQIEAMFHKARRLKLGARIAEGRLAAAHEALAGLVALAEPIEAAAGVADIDALAVRARAIAPHDLRLSTAADPARPPRAAPQKAPPHRTFLSRRGAPLWVGRNAAHNDELTLHRARPSDLWVHAKGRTGAHVIVPLDKGHSCPADLLVEAAHLAAHFSDARDEAVVEVQYTPRRYVRKPKGAAAGLVLVDREKVLVLRADPDLLRDLLAREQV